jgi:hypothetical protein
MNESINSDIWAALAEAEDALTLAEEQLHEVKSEAASEAYAFGDSGVGSFQSICRAELGVQGLRYRYEAILSQFNAMYEAA